MSAFAATYQQSQAQNQEFMMGMVQEKRFQAEREAARMEADALLRATLDDMKGAFHGLLQAKAAANPDVHNHIYQDGRNYTVDGRVSIDARSMDARTVNMYNEQQLLNQQLNAAFNLQHNSGSSSSGTKRDAEEVPANSSKRPPPAPPGAGAIRTRAQQFIIADGAAPPPPVPAPAPPPSPAPGAPPMSHLHQVGAIMLEKERIEREQAGIFAKVGKKGAKEEKGDERSRSRSISHKVQKPTKPQKPPRRNKTATPKD
jgi:hypothetical protein